MKWLYFKMFVFIMNWQVRECFLCCHGSCFSVLFLEKCDRNKHEIKWSQIENNSNSSSAHLQTLFQLNQWVVCCSWFCEFCKGEIFVKSPQSWNWWPSLMKLQNPKSFLWLPYSFFCVVQPGVLYHRNFSAWPLSGMFSLSFLRICLT